MPQSLAYYSLCPYALNDLGIHAKDWLDLFYRGPGKRAMVECHDDDAAGYSRILAIRGCAAQMGYFFTKNP